MIRDPSQATRTRLAQRLTLVFCVATLVTAAACTVLGFSPIWIAVPVVGAVACGLFNPVSGLAEMLWGGRR